MHPLPRALKVKTHLSAFIATTSTDVFICHAVFSAHVKVATLYLFVLQSVTNKGVVNSQSEAGAAPVKHSLSLSLPFFAQLRLTQVSSVTSTRVTWSSDLLALRPCSPLLELDLQEPLARLPPGLICSAGPGLTSTQQRLLLPPRCHPLLNP